jgi:hypothetical protein
MPLFDILSHTAVIPASPHPYIGWLCLGVKGRRADTAVCPYTLPDVGEGWGGGRKIGI